MTLPLGMNTFGNTAAFAQLRQDKWEAGQAARDHRAEAWTAQGGLDGARERLDLAARERSHDAATR